MVEKRCHAQHRLWGPWPATPLRFKAHSEPLCGWGERRVRTVEVRNGKLLAGRDISLLRGPQESQQPQALSKDQSGGLFAELGLAPSQALVAWQPARPFPGLQQLAGPAVLCQPKPANCGAVRVTGVRVSVCDGWKLCVFCILLIHLSSISKSPDCLRASQCLMYER